MSKATENKATDNDAEVLESEAENSQETVEIPSVEDSPLSEAVIDRTDEMQSTETKSFGLKEIPVDEDLNKLFSEIEKENKSKKDVPNASTKVETPEPQEPRDPKKKFSSKHILTIIDNALPKAAHFFVKLPEGEFTKAEVAGKYAQGTAKIIVQKNNSDEQKLTEIVKTWTPLMEDPLQEFMKERNIDFAPGTALALYGFLMVVVMLVTMNQIRRDNQFFLQEIRKLQNTQNENTQKNKDENNTNTAQNS